MSWAPNGERLWLQDLGGDTLRVWAAFGVDRAGNCYVGGSFAETMLFGRTLLESRGNRDLFLAKLNPGMPPAHASIWRSRRPH